MHTLLACDLLNLLFPHSWPSKCLLILHITSVLHHLSLKSVVSCMSTTPLCKWITCTYLHSYSHNMKHMKMNRTIGQFVKWRNSANRKVNILCSHSFVKTEIIQTCQTKVSAPGASFRRPFSPGYHLTALCLHALRVLANVAFKPFLAVYLSEKGNLPSCVKATVCTISGGEENHTFRWAAQELWSHFLIN